MVLAAALAPWLYRAGQSLAEAAATKDLPAVFEWLGAACGRSDFSRFYDRSLILCAVVLLPLVIYRVRLVRARQGGIAPAMPRMSWKCTLAQVAVGFVIAAGMFWGLGMIFQALGIYSLKPGPLKLGKVVESALIPALVAPLFEEWIFRGVLLGLWLRLSRPLGACIGTSLYFAFIHFLKPPDHSLLLSPSAPLAGFELLEKILLHFTDPQFFLNDFATLFFIGMILAWARVRTGALWFSIGLHSGWIMAFRAFNLLYRSVSDHPPGSWGVGGSMRSGLFPLLTLGLTAAICHFALRKFEAKGAVSRA